MGNHNALPAIVSHLPLTPFTAVLRVMREIFFVANSIEQRRSSQLNRAEELFVRIQRLGVPKLDVSKLLTFKFVAITAVRI